MKKTLDLKVIRNLIYPYLPVLVGTNVGGKPNFITIGLIGWLCYDVLSVSIGRRQYSRAGLLETGTFSINQPSAGLLKKLDYCGLESGRAVDKAALFETFYGQLETAPMIAECPVNIECRVIGTLERKVHTVFLGEVAAVHVDGEAMVDGALDVKRIDPVFYGPDPSAGRGAYAYWGLGRKLGRAFEVGRGLAAS